MFGERPYTYIKNGINLNKYRYSEENRTKIRNTLGIGNEFVIGHVGRFLPVKNHHFILDIFKEVLKSQPEAKLLLI